MPFQIKDQLLSVQTKYNVLFFKILTDKKFYSYGIQHDILKCGYIGEWLN